MRPESPCPMALVSVLLALAPATSLAQASPAWEAELHGNANLLVGGSGDVLDGGFGLDLVGGRRLASPIWVDAGLSYIDLAAQTGGIPGQRADNALFSITGGFRLWAGGRPVGAFLSGRAGPVAVLRSTTPSRAGEAGTDWGLAGLVSGGIRVGLGERAGILGTAGLMRTSELEFVRASPEDPTVSTTVTQLRVGLGVHLFLR